MKIILKVQQDNGFNAGDKAPSDVNNILGCKIINLTSIYDNNKHKVGKVLRYVSYSNIIKNMSNKDLYIIQHPYLYINNKVASKLYSKQSIVLIHDLSGLRTRNDKLNVKEIRKLNLSKFIISHNQVMTNYLISQGIDSKKIVNLELFDYLCDEVEYRNKDISKGLTIAYAGNIDKALFIKQIDKTKMNFEMNLYGVKSDNLQINDKLHYIGKETPERLPNLIDAHLGLVWDGNIDSSDESDILKNYTKYNNPHKVSCYLAAGIPVIVWSKSAIWNFVRDNNCGYAIDNIYDINNLDLSDYEEKRKNAIEISKKVRSGYYTKKAFNTAFEKLGLEDRIK